MTFIPRFYIGDLELTDYPFAVEYGTELGRPENVVQLLDSMLQDGQVVSTSRSNNRTMVLPILIDHRDLQDAAQSQQLLDLECAKDRNTLTVDPGDFGPLTVFEIFRFTPEFRRNDDEEQSGFRRFLLTIPALPFGMSADSVTDIVETVSAPAADAQINACDATTGWAAISTSTTRAIDTTIKVEGTGSLKLTGQTRHVGGFGAGGSGGGWGAVFYEVSETGIAELTGLSLTTPATRPYMSFKGYVGDSFDFQGRMWANGVETSPVSVTFVNPSWALFTFRTDLTATITTIRTSLKLYGDFNGVPKTSKTDPDVPNVPSTWAPRFDDLRRSGSPSAFSRQSLRSIPIQGAARTQGSVAMSHATNGLGKVFIYSSPILTAGQSPNILRYCTGSLTTDTASISGKKIAFSALGAPTVFEIPASQIARGGYQLWAFMETGTLDVDNLEIQVTAATKIGSVTLASKSYSQQIVGTGDGVYQFVDCGSLVLPNTDVPVGGNALVRLTIELAEASDPTRDLDASTATLQELYLPATDEDSSLTVVDCGGTGTAALGTANSRMWIDSASLASGNPSLWVGTLSDRTDSYHAGDLALRWQPLSLRPPETLLYTANSGGSDVKIDVTHTPRWPGLAAS